MKREIKFRVWNGLKMEYNIMAGFLGAFYVQGIDEKDSASMSPFNTKYFDDTPLMQFTGLKDKNGKEIYDGDLYQVAKNKVYTISYSEGDVNNYEWFGGCFVMTFNKLNIPGKTDCFPFDEYAIKNGEVIGNIYENKSLIE